ncbi:hypothetical protein DSO57_1015317 [Entomophthora muscae]|uniref:Uncharacterized protein n=1 Tax=Entomophthora muscae TaxID=34485 RepID=A0ACC2UEH4_9FUNG|nr:hypothetical protein DSO57_1015317 [Entomophthora muscae]
MSEEDKRSFYCLSHKAQHVLICGTQDRDTKSIFTDFNGFTFTEVQQGNTPLADSTLDVYKWQKPIVPQELQPVSEKRPSNKPAESHLKKVVNGPLQEIIIEQVFDNNTSPLLGNSGVTLSSPSIRLASANLFGNTPEPLYH